MKNKDGLKWNATLKRWGLSSSKAEADDDDDFEQDDPQEESSTHATAEKSTNQSSVPTKGNPVNIAVYGQICLAAKSYQSALCTFDTDLRAFELFLTVITRLIVYLLHAYDYCEEDPMICLCLAIASIGRAMQRQADNRHHLITQVCFYCVFNILHTSSVRQGMAFLNKYRTLRIDQDEMDEVEFNFGRAFHQLGNIQHD